MFVSRRIILRCPAHGFSPFPGTAAPPTSPPPFLKFQTPSVVAVQSTLWATIVQRLMCFQISTTLVWASVDVFSSHPRRLSKEKKEEGNHQRYAGKTQGKTRKTRNNRGQQPEGNNQWATTSGQQPEGNNQRATTRGQISEFYNVGFVVLGLTFLTPTNHFCVSPWRVRGRAKTDLFSEGV